MAIAASIILGWHGLAAAAEATTGDHAVIDSIDHVMVCVSNLNRAAAAHADLFGDEFHAIDPLALAAWGINRSAISATGIELIARVVSSPTFLAFSLIRPVVAQGARGGAVSELRTVGGKKMI